MKCVFVLFLAITIVYCWDWPEDEKVVENGSFSTTEKSSGNIIVDVAPVVEDVVQAPTVADTTTTSTTTTETIADTTTTSTTTTEEVVVEVADVVEQSSFQPFAATATSTRGQDKEMLTGESIDTNGCNCQCTLAIKPSIYRLVDEAIRSHLYKFENRIAQLLFEKEVMRGEISEFEERFEKDESLAQPR
jgi:hypothetical protein